MAESEEFETRLTTELKDLDSSIRRAYQIVCICFAVMVILYIGWFKIKHDLDLSTDSQKWGGFGDFVGGLLNPLVAFSAFYWLTKSVRLQKEELIRTRHALLQGNDAQRDQLAVSRDALAIQVDAVNTQLELARKGLAIQQEQLKDARLSLERNHAAQLAQLECAQKVARTNARAAIISSYNEQIAHYRSEIEFMINQPTFKTSKIAFNYLGTSLSEVGINNRIKELNSMISGIITRRDAILRKLKGRPKTTL